MNAKTCKRLRRTVRTYFRNLPYRVYAYGTHNVTLVPLPDLNPDGTQHARRFTYTGTDRLHIECRRGQYRALKAFVRSQVA